MSEIKAGDVVVIVKPTPCCGDTGKIGVVFTVDWLAYAAGICNACGAGLIGAFVLEDEAGGAPRALVRKIEPLADPETIETDLEVTA